MKKLNRAIGMAVVAAVALGGVATPVSPASAQTIKVCVKKKTGEMRMAKKCKKGWKKVSWNSVGPIGPAGPPGPQIKVVDKNGVVLGDYWGSAYVSLVPYMFVGFQGGGYSYLADGRVLPSGSSPRFREGTCTTSAYVNLTPGELAYYLNSVGSTGRLLYRPTNPIWQAPKAYKLTSTLQAHSGVLWQFDDTGACVATAPFTGTLVKLEQVTAPQDGAGPLTLR
jgi:hypothetical protein